VFWYKLIEYKDMAAYYFLGTLLPELHIGEAPEIGFSEFDQLLRDNLSTHDYAKTKTIRNLYDISNLRAYWKDEPFDHYGNFTPSELEEALVTRSMLPDFVFNFIDKYESNEERLRHYPELLAIFFRNAISKASGFFEYYLSLERELRLVLVAFRAKKMNRDIFNELQYENPEEDFIAQILAQRDSASYEPPEKYEEIKMLFEQHYDNAVELQKSLLEYRFSKIDEKLGIELFSMDRVLAYMIELIMVERWQQMDKQKGLKIVDSMLKEPS
jgi:hypothetical protein